MSAYVILDIEVTDPQSYEVYRQLAQATVSAHGGQYVVRGGKAEVLEGDWIPKRCVVVRFATVDQAKAWWDSDEYKAAMEVRHRAACTQAILVEGV